MSWKVKIDPADTAFSQYIRLRDGHCKRCGSLVQFNAKGLPITHQASHFQSRRKEATRFDPENVDTLCAGCHGYFGENPLKHYEWQLEQKGQGTVEAIVLRSNMYQKKDRESEKLYWRQEVKKLLESRSRRSGTE